jgi:hypothetical protein
LAIAGCGSSQSGLSKSALTTKVNAICKHRSNTITAAASKVLAGGKLPSPAQFGALAHGTIIPQTGAEIDELSALKPQSKLAGAYKQWLASLRAALGKMRQNPVIIQSRAAFISVNRQADAQGFSSSCHVGPG